MKDWKQDKIGALITITESLRCCAVLLGAASARAQEADLICTLITTQRPVEKLLASEAASLSRLFDRLRSQLDMEINRELENEEGIDLDDVDVLPYPDRGA